jgi:hypothetical protein
MPILYLIVTRGGRLLAVGNWQAGRPAPLAGRLLTRAVL